MVSGHFIRLLEHSEHARFDPVAKSWLAEFGARRETWFAKWRSFDPEARDLRVAAEALEWLWAFDEASLWICCRCPAGREARQGSVAVYASGAGTPVEMELADAEAAAMRNPTRGVANAKPWRFDVESLELEASALLVRARRYDSPQQLLAAGRPDTLRWSLVPSA
jgi:hypothetical protein